MTPARSLFVHNSGDRYGASRSLLRLVPRLAALGEDPLVLLPEEGPLAALLQAQGVQVMVDPSISIVTRQQWSPTSLAKLLASVPVSARRIADLVRRRRVELIHTNTGVILSPALAARLAGVPHVWHIRDSFHEFRSAWPLFARYILALSSRVIAVSEAIAAQFPRSSKLRVVYNGVPAGEFEVDRSSLRESFRSRHGLAGPVVGCVGRIKLGRKGQEDLITAASLLRARGVEARYLVVGSASPGSEDHLPRLREQVSRLGLDREVVFAGELEDPRPAYAAMDVFVLPSAQPEPFGGVVLEAMAMGLPVVATATGGTVEQVVDGVTGALVPPADPRAMADALEPLLRDRSRRVDMGQQGRARVADRFALDRTAAQVLEIHDEVRAGRERRR